MVTNGEDALSQMHMGDKGIIADHENDIVIVEHHLECFERLEHTGSQLLLIKSIEDSTLQ